MEPLEAPIEEVAQLCGTDVDALRVAAKDSREMCVSLRNGLEVGLADRMAHLGGLDVVVTGSIARSEITEGSDCDYLVLVTENVGHSHIIQCLREMEALRSEFDLGLPGAQGVFGDFVTATELLGRIGLQGDSNTNITRRLVLLAESQSLLHANVREGVVREIVLRYCADYEPGNRPDGKPFGVPRFLLNDVVRFWRTMSVDFGAKRWRSVLPDWQLRYAKLITTRKVLFAGTLMTLFRAKLELADLDQEAKYDRLVAFLIAEFDLSPLSRLMGSYPLLGAAGQASLCRILDAYCQVIELLNRRGAKKVLKEAKDETGHRFVELRDQLETLAEQIQEDLEVVFFDDDAISPLTRRYALF